MGSRTMLERVLKSMKLCPNGDLEFCWRTSLYRNQKIIPDEIRDQGNQATCVFETVSAGGDMALLKKKADEDPPKTTSVRLKSRSLVEGYQREVGVEVGEDTDAEQRSIREDTALLLFRRDGIEATDGTRVKISNSHIQRGASWVQIANHILHGRPVLGTVIVGDDFGSIGPDEVYEFRPEEEGEKKQAYNHMVNCGDRRGFLKFVNCGGTGFGDGGLGRIYFKYVHTEKSYVLYDATVIDADETGASTSSTPGASGASTSSTPQGGSINMHPADTRRRRGRDQDHEELFIPRPAQRRRGSSSFPRRRNRDYDELYAESGSPSASNADD